MSQSVQVYSREYRFGANKCLYVQSTAANYGIDITFWLVSDELLDKAPILHWGVNTRRCPQTWSKPERNSDCLKYFTWNDTEEVIDDSTAENHLDKNCIKCMTTEGPGAAQTTFIDAACLPPAIIPPHFAHKSKRLWVCRLSFVKPIVDDSPLLQNFGPEELPLRVEYVLLLGGNQWHRDGQRNFSVDIAPLAEAMVQEAAIKNAAAELMGHRDLDEFEIQRWDVQTAGGSFPLHLYVSASHPDFLELHFFASFSHPLACHWGLSESADAQWRAADPRHLLAKYPGKSESTPATFPFHPFSALALQSEFVFAGEQTPLQHLRILLSAEGVASCLKFVIKEVKANTWYRDPSGADFTVRLPQNDAYIEAKRRFEKVQQEEQVKVEAQKAQIEAAWKKALLCFVETRSARADAADIVYAVYGLSDNGGEIEILGFYDDENGLLRVQIVGCFRVPVILHWGCLQCGAGKRQRFAQHEWLCPPPHVRPTDTVVADELRSCDTPLGAVEDLAYIQRAKSFGADESDLLMSFCRAIELCIPAKRDVTKSETDTGVLPEIAGLAFVFRELNGSRWFKATDYTDFRVRLTTDSTGKWKGLLPDVAESILSAEVGSSHMTLMHRYNLVNNAVDKWMQTQFQLAGSGAGSGANNYVRSFTSLFRADSKASWQFPLELPNVAHAMVSAQTKALDGSAARTAEESVEFWSWMFVWLRLSYMGLLDWQRNYNTKPRDLAHAAESLAHKFGEAYKAFPAYRPLIRLALSTVGRGGGGGQAIRDRILEIMHRHKIPEASGNFYEQWHQKLHNNTTPDDIPICRAVIAYLCGGGNLSEYWRVLSEHGISRERMASYDRKIVAEPYLVQCDVGALISDLRSYHDILVDVHDAVDLRKSFQHAQGFLGADAGTVEQALHSAGPRTGMQLKAGVTTFDLSADEAHHRFVTLSEARRRVLTRVTKDMVPAAAVRDLLFLDFALEQQQLLPLQAARAADSFSTLQLVQQLATLTVQLAAHFATHESLTRCSKDLVALAESCVLDGFQWGSRESALLLNSLADRLALIVGALVETWQSGFGLKAQFIGNEAGLEEKTINVFVDEVLRGSSLFGISITLKRLEPKLRAAAELPPWQIIAPATTAIKGQVVCVPALIGIQDQTFSVPTVLISGAVSGEEEIPTGVQAVLVRSAAESPDILSHVAVRARNAHVLLAVCFDTKLASTLDQHEGSWVNITVSPNGAALTIAKEQPPAAIHPPLLRRPTYDRQLTQKHLVVTYESDAKEVHVAKKAACFDLTTQSEKWVVTPPEFTRKNVGSKSLNLTFLRPLLPSNIITPAASALPFGCMQKTLAHQPDAATIVENLTAVLGRLQQCCSPVEAGDIFEKAQDMVHQLKCPHELTEAFRKTLMEDNTLKPLSDRLPKEECFETDMWNAIKSVWASLFAVRPWVSLLKANRSYMELSMAVLVQQMLPATYAFVLHSENPFDSTVKEEMYGELVVGVGEVLVGNSPGRAMAWRMKRGQEPRVVSFPSKDYALRCEDCLIFRSDSNGEDLDGFAGAGLFESIPEKPNKILPLTYNYVKLVTDRPYRQRLLQQIGELAFSIADAFGAPMDIEGCVLGEDQIAVVQARPQV